MPNGRPIGRACENIFAHGRNWAGGSNDTSFRAGLGSPKKFKMCIRAGWAAHFLLGFAYVAQMFFQCLTVAADCSTGPHLYSAVPEQYRNVGLTALGAVYAYYRVMTNFCTALWHYFGGVL